MGIEMELFDEQMSVALFSRNYKPVGTRFLTLKDFDKFLPTIAIFSSGEEIELNVYWHTVVSVPPRFNVVRYLNIFFHLVKIASFIFYGQIEKPGGLVLPRWYQN